MSDVSLNVLFSYKHLNMEILPSIEDIISFKTSKIKNHKKYNNKKHYNKKYNNNNTITPINTALIKKKNNKTDDEKIKSEMRSILNKISSDNFTKLVDDILKIKITSIELLNFLVELLFEKAIVEHKYSSLYAEISLKFIDITFDNVTLRKLLLNKCQQSFMKYLKNELDDTFKLKGYMQYLGELYNIGIFYDAISTNCIKMMIKAAQNNTDNVVSMIKIYIKTIWNKFTKHELFNIIMNDIIILKSTKGISVKDKFAIMDLEDMYKKL